MKAGSANAKRKIVTDNGALRIILADAVGESLTATVSPMAGVYASGKYRRKKSAGKPSCPFFAGENQDDSVKYRNEICLMTIDSTCL